MENTISYKQMLQQMESSNASFSLKWATFSGAKKTGGGITGHHALVLKRNPIGRKENARAGNSEKADTLERKAFFNLFDKEAKRYFRVWKRLIIEFNGQKVTY